MGSAPFTVYDMIFMTYTHPSASLVYSLSCMVQVRLYNNLVPTQAPVELFFNLLQLADIKWQIMSCF